ncbi:MAG TPA: DUF6776 family protein [Rudaea sp.]
MAHVTPPPVLIVRPQQSARGRYYVIAVLWIATVLLAAGIERWLDQRQIAVGPSASERDAVQKIEELQQRVTVLERSEQVARAANLDLQQNLRDRQEEIAGLRADLGFYSRLTGGGAKREGLSVQGLHLASGSNPRVYNFTATLTQTLKGGQTINGRARVSVNGVLNGKLTTVPWTDLASNQDSGGLPFSFKYFQQLSGSLMLPEGFTPNKIRIDAEGGGENGHTEREFAWSEAMSNPEVPDVTR